MEKSLLRIVIPTKGVRRDLLLSLLSQLRSLSLGENILLVIDLPNRDRYLESLGFEFRYSNGRGFSFAVNLGSQEANSEYLLLLNDDVIVYPKFLEDLFKGIESGFDIVGPVSNYAGGIQSRLYNVNENNYLEFMSKSTSKALYIPTSFLSGFCLLGKRDIFLKFRFNEKMKNYFSDNLFSWLCYINGYYLGIVENCFIYHFGSQTLNLETEDTFEDDLVMYLKQMKKLQSKPSIAVLLRVLNGMEYIRKGFVDEFLNIGDKLFVVDTGSTDGTYEYFKKLRNRRDIFLTSYKEKEDLERTLITEQALKEGYNWALWLDIDEVPDFSREYLLRIANNSIFPEITNLNFRVLTFWRGNTHHRTDGVWGNLSGNRFFRLIKGKTKWITTHPEGLHCSNVVSHDLYGRRYSSKKILHYGYNTIEKVYQKYNYYTTVDKYKSKELIGTADYSHIIDESNLSLTPFTKKSVGLFMITKQEKIKKHFIFSLRKIFTLFDEICIGVDDRSTEKLFSVLDLMKISSKKIHFKDFSQARNETKANMKSSYLFFLDDDETLISEFEFSKLLEKDFENLLFEITNVSGSLQYKSYSIRLFKNTKQAKFEGKIHEQVKVGPSVEFGGNLIINIKEKIDFEFYKNWILKDKTPVNMAKLYIDEGKYEKAIKILKKLPETERMKNYLLVYCYLVNALILLEDAKHKFFGSRKEYLGNLSLQLKRILKEYLTN